MVIVLTWAVYRQNRAIAQLRDELYRENKRLNDVLYKLTRGKTTGKKPGKTSVVDVIADSGSEKEIVCPNCNRKYSSIHEKCPFCGCPAPNYNLKWE